VTSTILLGALVAGAISAAALVRATSACFILVYILALASAVRISSGALRAAAVIALALICVVGVFSSWYLFVPAVAALLSIGFRHTATRHVQDRRDQRERGDAPPPRSSPPQ
jgi:amino acid efflux transporter